MSLTGKKIEELINIINDLICEDSLLDRDDRSTLIKAVAVAGAAKARLQASSQKPGKENKEKIPRVTDPRFPNAGKPWTGEDESFLHGIIDELPDDAIDGQVVWLAEKLGRTPYSVACKIVLEGRCSKAWRSQYQSLTESIRESGLDIATYMAGYKNNQ